MHGIVSLSLIGVATGWAGLVIGRHSTTAMVVYAVLLGAAVGIVLYAFCAKCFCREQGCAHILPGILAGWLPKRTLGPYGFWDKAGLGLGLAVVAGYPQYWLGLHPLELAGYWSLMLLAGWEIRCAVCPMCANAICPLHPSRRR